jgi:hypothetical protein
LFSCVHITLGSSPSFTYDSGFVTGYMTTAWASAGSIPVTGYAVLNYRETNVWLEQTDHVYPSSAYFNGDYTKRWLYFDAYPIVASAVTTAGGPKVVMVQYDFSTSPPTVLQVVDEAGWDMTYATYGSAIGKTFVVENSLWQDVNPHTDIGYVGMFRDVGITLGTNTVPIWWWSGQTIRSQVVAKNNLLELNPAFTPRAAYNRPTNGASTLAPIEPPFLRLTYNPSGGGGGSGPVTSQGHVY